MRKIIVIQHVGHEPLGTLNPMLKSAGFRIRYVNFGRHPHAQPSLDGYYGLILLGGPMGVYEADKIPHIKFEMQLIEQALKRNIPVLGICLGAQLIAGALGARVYPSNVKEMGWHTIHATPDTFTDPLFSAYQPSERFFELHQDTFDLPKSAVHLASSENCESQAFRYGDRVYGLQFHLEADNAMIKRWLARREYKRWIKDSQGGLLAATIESETQMHIDRSVQLSQHTFGKFIDIFGLPERTEVLGSEHGKPK